MCDLIELWGHQTTGGERVCPFAWTLEGGRTTLGGRESNERCLGSEQAQKEQEHDSFTKHTASLKQIHKTYVFPCKRVSACAVERGLLIA